MGDPRPFIAEAAAGADPAVSRSFPVRVGRTLRFIWSHRLYTWRYWILGIRFLKFKVTHPHIKTEGFVFLGPKLCLPLPSHDASRRRSGGSARDTYDQGSQRTYTSKSRAMPGAQQNPSAGIIQGGGAGF